MKLVEIKDGKVCYKKMFSILEADVADIVNCYKRIEEATATTCCSRSDFSSVFLVLVMKDNTKLKLETTEKICRESLELIKQMNSQVVVGFKKE